MLKKLCHIGVMVEDFDRAIQQFTGFGLTCSEIKEDRKIDLQAGFLSIGDTAIEILHHTKPDRGDNLVSGVVRGRKGPSTLSASRSTTWMRPSGILSGTEPKLSRAAPGREPTAGSRSFIRRQRGAY